MKKYYSNVDKDKLLHVVYRLEDAAYREEQRVDIVNPTQFIQCASLNMKKGTTFRPHKHIWKDKNMKVIAQESWVVLSGSVKCIFYDIDDTVLDTPILLSGDCSFTFEGGHNYEILEDNTIVLEYKTGPYDGQQKDKEFI